DRVGKVQLLNDRDVGLAGVTNPVVDERCPVQRARVEHIRLTRLAFADRVRGGPDGSRITGIPSDVPEVVGGSGGRHRRPVVALRELARTLAERRAGGQGLTLDPDGRV